MTFIGIDDTDTIDTRGTNQLARAIACAAEPDWECRLIIRHQLLDDPRVPFTSKNGSASITLRGADGASIEPLIELCRNVMREWFVDGSDPGLCVTQTVPPALIDFGLRCKTTLISQSEARNLAARHGIHLEGLGGTQGGVIGALAAVGLAACGNDGRVVRLGSWDDDLSGVQPIEEIRRRDVGLYDVDGSCDVTEGLVDLGKRLRPNRTVHRTVLYVRRAENAARDERASLYTALRLP